MIRVVFARYRGIVFAWMVLQDKTIYFVVRGKIEKLICANQLNDQ